MKALASDLDGTLFFQDLPGNFKDGDLKGIRQFQENGHLFGLCTGRPYSGVVQGAIDYDFCIVSSGALILDKDGVVLYEQCIDYRTVKRIFMDFQEEVHLYVQANKRMYTLKKGRFPLEQIEITSVEDLEGYSIQGISIDAGNQKIASIITKRINEKYGRLVEAFQNVECVDIVKKGCSKGAALEFYKKQMHIRQLCGIGDSYNDIPMLESVDYAFTFNHAPESLKIHADRLVDSVAQALEIVSEN
ncbi:MAG: HAD-IIB family hydrolase [Erysipelotrichaceae bacterium]|nr:HAD-IIB family hydrolase [Erysipelotrichaceae bacterium]